ncbi:hypothetical protein [Bdellovibrio sp. HCB337]|uniref:hypothetical protein n=1 Tax=Bdellovibrio sp. HCB337 TaxID=3394358 RepID=UPI0039A40AD0
MKFQILFVVFFVSVLSFPSKGPALEVPPEWKFKKISTPHFDIIYNSTQQDLGELYAQQMEKAFELLSPVFTSVPQKTLVIINDKTDATNGYATRVPYPHIMTYPVLPGPQESLSESGDWALELLAHEYTHILTFEPANGFFRVLRGVLGTIAAPNILLPSWWKEGIAVQTESMLSEKGGRLKSMYQDALLRAMSDDKTLQNFDIAQVNEYIPTWPEGMRPYVFGSVFWSQAVSDYGASVMNSLNQRHAGRVPYFVETPAKDLLKDNYEGFYKKAVRETDTRAQAQLKKLREKPPSEVHRLPIEAKYSSAPAISEDGKYLALITVDYKADRVLDIFTRDPETKLITKKLKVEIKKEEEPLVPKNNDGPPSGSIQKISWFHKSPKLIYDQLHYVNRTERYSDLYLYDLTTEKSEKLTSSLRGREPSMAPNDDKVVFVKLEGGRTRLGVYDIAGKKDEILYSPAMQERISSPIYLDAETIIFALRNAKGEEGLWTYSFKDQKVTSVLTDFAQARFPVMTKKGMMFTSAKNGVHNLYLASADLKTAKPVTHVTTMVSSSAMDPESEHLYVTYMGSVGPSVVRIAKENWEKTPEELPQIEGLFADRYKNPLRAPAAAPTPEASPTPAATPATTAATAVTTTPATPTPAPSPSPTPQYEITDYSPWGYLWPRYWMPFIWTSSEGGLSIQAMTSGADPLKKHNYDLMIGWNTFLEAVDWSANYVNNVTNTPIQATAAQTHSYLVTRDNLVNDTLFSVSGTPEVWKFSEKLTLSLGWRYLERSVTTLTPTKRTGPFVSLIYKNMTQGGEQFTPQSGGGAYLMAVEYIQGVDLFSHRQYQAGGVYYFSKFLPKLHAIVLRSSIMYTPEKVSYIYGTQSDSMDFYGQDLSSKFLARGYSTGQFVGRSMYNANIEYRFNVSDMYKGWGTTAAFARRLYAAVTADAISTDGFAFDFTTEKYTAVTSKDVFLSYGLEGHFETTIGYEFPVNFVFGVYQGTDKKYAPEPRWDFAVQLGVF